MRQVCSGNNEKLRKLNLSIYETTFEKATLVAKAEGRSISNFFRWVVDSFYEKLTKDNKN